MQAYKRYIKAVEELSDTEIRADAGSFDASRSSGQRRRHGSTSPPLSSKSPLRGQSAFGFLPDTPVASEDSSSSPSKQKKSPLTRSEALALGHNAIAIDYAILGDLPSALIAHAKHAQVTRDSRSRAIALCNAGMIHRMAADLIDADACFQSALSIARSTGDHVAEMLACGHLGIDAALATVQSSGPDLWSQTKAREVPTDANAATATRAVKARLLDKAAIDDATEALLVFLRLQTKDDDPRNVGTIRSALGVLAHASGDYDAAIEHFSAARAVGHANANAKVRETTMTQV